MNLKKGAPLDVLALYQKLKEPVKVEKATPFDELFALSFKIRITMKKALDEILKRKELTFHHTTFTKKILKNDDSILKEESVQADQYRILNIKDVTLGYDKYTFLSKKEYFYVINFDHIATIRVCEADNTSEINVLDTDYYDALLKLSKNINEYFKTEVVIAGNKKDTVNSIVVKKTDLDNLKDEEVFLKQYEGISLFGNNIKKFISSSTVAKRVYFYERDRDYGGY